MPFNLYVRQKRYDNFNLWMIMEMIKSKKQQKQEDQYSFPYHYVPQFRDGFTQTFYWSWGLHYISGVEFILEKLKELEFQSLIDIGTGDGRLVREMALEFPNKDIIGLDYSARAVALASALNPSLNFICKDIINEQIANTFDCITLIEVIEHVPNEKTQYFIKSLNKLLKKNGLLLLTVPHQNLKMPSRHYQHFTANTLKKQFGSYFKVEEEIFIDKKSRIVTILHKLLGNRIFTLKSRKLQSIIYNIYKKKFFFTTERDCLRIFMKLRKID